MAENRESEWADLFIKGCNGDGQAYACFLRSVAPVLRGIIRQRGSAAMEVEVEDMVQEALLAIHQKRHTWEQDKPLLPWLYAIARYKAVDGWRKRGKSTVDIQDHMDTLASADVDIMAAHDVGSLMVHLDEKSAYIVHEMSINGETAANIGDKLGMSEGAVRVTLHRALEKLKGLVDKKVLK